MAIKYKFNNKTLTFTPIKQSYKQGIIGFILGILIFTGLSFKLNNVKIEQIPTIIKIWEENREFTPEKLKNSIYSLNFQYPDIIYAQAVLETSNFQSPIFKQNNNCFGMKKAESRITTNEGIQLNHAYYSSWESSLIDRALWDASYARNLSKEQYLQLLGEIYAEDEQYINKLKKLTQ